MPRLAIFRDPFGQPMKEGQPLPHPALPTHLVDWSAFVVPVSILVGRYLWKAVVWLVAPGLGKLIAQAIRKVLQPEFLAIHTRLDRLEQGASARRRPPRESAEGDALDRT